MMRTKKLTLKEINAMSASEIAGLCNKPLSNRLLLKQE